jgi:hypothetical protein
MNLRIAGSEKVELHCHIDGILDPQMAASLRARGHDFGFDPDDFARRYPFDSAKKWGTDYYDFLDPYLVPLEERLSAILDCHIERLKSQRVTYAEIFVSRLLGTTNDFGALTEMFRRLRHRAEVAAGEELEIELVVAVGRGQLPRLEKQAAKVTTLFDAGLISGVALAGDEAACDVASLQPVFERFRDRGMGIEIHAGELLPATSVWDAVLHRSRRLGVLGSAPRRHPGGAENSRRVLSDEQPTVGRHQIDLRPPTATSLGGRCRVQHQHRRPWAIRMLDDQRARAGDGSLRTDRCRIAGDRRQLTSGGVRKTSPAPHVQIDHLALHA